MERQIINFQDLNGNKLSKLNEEIKKMDENFEDLTNVTVDLSIPDIKYSSVKVTDKSLTSLGAGHQSLITMMLPNI